MKIKLSDYIWDYVSKIGVKHVFMFPGGGAMHLVDSLGNAEQLGYITLLHEQACTMAAETYSRIDHNLGVVLVTTGPGGTNTVTGVAAAWLESTPVLVISGQAKTDDLKGDSGVRQKGNQEIGIVDIVSSITKYSVMVTEPDMIKYHLDRAVYEAKNGRMGPVWLDIPLDVQSAMIDPEKLHGYQKEEKKDSSSKIDSQIKNIVSLLKQSRKPVVIAGQGIERNNGKEKFRELVEKLRIPVLTSWIGVELLEYDNKYNFGKPGMVAPRYSNFVMQGSDLIIAIGTRLDPAMIGYNPDDFAPQAKKVVVDIDEAEIEKHKFRIDEKVILDATEFINLLLKEVEQQDERSEWLNQCKMWKEKYPIVLPEYYDEQDTINPYVFIDKLSDCLAEGDVIIPGSSGACIDVYWLCFKNKSRQRTLATGSLGSMGYGIPAAIGACMASGKRTICVEGDGSLQLNIQEFASIKGMNLPIKVFVLNNGGYLSIMNMQRNHFGGHFVGANQASNLYIPDISGVAKSYGFCVYELEYGMNIEETIKKVINTKGPVLCNVHMKDSIVIQPKVVSKVTENGSMVSGSLSEMWPYVEEKINIDTIITNN